MMLTYKNFGQCLKYYRETQKLSLTAMSQKVGISLSYLSLLESNKRSLFNPKLLKRIAKSYEIPYQEVLKLAGYLDDATKIEMTQSKEKKKNEVIAVLS